MSTEMTEPNAIQQKIDKRLNDINEIIANLKITGTRGDRDEVIDPLSAEATDYKVSANYHIQPAPVKVAGHTIPGWRADPRGRGFEPQFRNALDKRKAAGKALPDATAYWFTHEEGVKARLTYEAKVLTGKVKANKTSWGPNPESQKEDKSRFHKFTGVTFQELEQMYPEMYGSSSASKSSSSTEQAVELPEGGLSMELDVSATTEEKATGEGDVSTQGKSDDQILAEIQGEETAGDTMVEDTNEPVLGTTTEVKDITEEEGPTDEQIEAEEETAQEAVAASTTVEDDLELEIDTESEQGTAASALEEATQTGRDVITSLQTETDGPTLLKISHPTGSEQKVTATSITWDDTGSEPRTAYLVWVESLDKDLWLEEGEHVIDGEDIVVQVEQVPSGGNA